MKIKTTYTVSDSKLHTLLSCAFEGGIGYWCRMGESQGPDEIVVNGENVARFIGTEPISETGSITLEYEIYDDPDVFETVVLTRAKLETGLQILADKYPRHFADIVNDNEDANTGDALVQCAVFGDIIYG